MWPLIYERTSSFLFVVFSLFSRVLPHLLSFSDDQSQRNIILSLSLSLFSAFPTQTSLIHAYLTDITTTTSTKNHDILGHALPDDVFVQSIVVVYDAASKEYYRFEKQQDLFPAKTITNSSSSTSPSSIRKRRRRRRRR